MRGVGWLTECCAAVRPGEGGNDLLGNKKQVEDQKLARGNRALLGNISLGLPVRVFRRNDDCASATNSVLFFDGLYDVVRGCVGAAAWCESMCETGPVM